MSQQYDPTDLRGQERSKAEELAERREEARKEVEDLKHVMGRKEYGMKLRLQIEAICPELYDKMRNEAIKNVRNTDDGTGDHTN